MITKSREKSCKAGKLRIPATEIVCKTEPGAGIEAGRFAMHKFINDSIIHNAILDMSDVIMWLLFSKSDLGSALGRLSLSLSRWASAKTDQLVWLPCNAPAWLACAPVQCDKPRGCFSALLLGGGFEEKVKIELLLVHTVRCTAPLQVTGDDGFSINMQHINNT